MKVRGGSLRALALLVCVLPASAGFTVASGVTDPCHERVTVAAYRQAAVRLPDIDEDRVPSGDWEDIMDRVVGKEVADNRAERFILFSLLVGVRAPDGEGYSLTNLSALRAIQSDADGQYVHCLRAAEDDYYAGNATAVEGCILAMVASLREAASYDPTLGDKGGRELIEVPFSLDAYGVFEVEVAAMPYYLGRALHTFQDSFTHTLRSPDMRRIVHVMNYEAAIADTLVEERDGMPHSAATDACALVPDETGELVNRDRVFAAVEATADLLRAFTRYLELRQTDPENTDRVEAEFSAVLAKWMRLEDPSNLGDFDECVQENDYCDSPWLGLARLRPAGPVLPCAVTTPGARGLPAPGWALGIAWCAVVLVGRRVRRRRGRS